jgi:peptidoglycan/LPS O-acetylase OafA/YrhL
MAEAPMSSQILRWPLPRTGGLLAYLRMERSPNALAELDGLRAIAILLVLGRHAVHPYFDAASPILPIAGWDAAALLLNGWIGVDLFFVLSGFLITKHLLSRLDDPNGLALGPYLAKRALRIVPAYYAVLLLVAAGIVPMYTIPQDALSLRLGYHALFLQDYLPANIVVAFWSLGVEEKFYLLAPLLLAAVATVRRPEGQLTAVALIAMMGPALRMATTLVHPDVDQYPLFFRTFRSPFHACIDALMMGVLGALIYRHRERLAWARDPRAVALMLWFGIALSGWLLLTAPLLDHIDGFDKVVQPLLIALAAGAILCGVALRARPIPALRGPLLFVLAKLSYCLYLVHLPLIPGLIWLLDGPLGLAHATPVHRFAAFLPLFACSSLLAAALLHYLVEKPFLVLKDRF